MQITYPMKWPDIFILTKSSLDKYAKTDYIPGTAVKNIFLSLD